MARWTDARFDMSNDRQENRDVEVGPDDDVATGIDPGGPEHIQVSDRDPTAFYKPPRTERELVPHRVERLGEDTPDRAELVVWLENLADVDDRAFTTSERAEIRDEIKKLRADVEKLTELTRHQQKAIDERLTEVRRGSETMGRKDWLTLAIGAAISLVIMESVPPLILWPLMVKGFHALSHLFVLDA